MKQDEIEIRRLEVETKIGVPDEERATPQKLWISVWMVPEQDFTNLGDRVANTVDYAEAAGRITKLAGAKSQTPDRDSCRGNGGRAAGEVSAAVGDGEGGKTDSPGCGFRGGEDLARENVPTRRLKPALRLLRKCHTRVDRFLLASRAYGFRTVYQKFRQDTRGLY